MMNGNVAVDGSKEEPHPGDQHEVPRYEAHASSTTLKERIRHHYELTSDYYYTLWGQHIHHGLFTTPSETKEEAQINLIKHLLEISSLQEASHVLDVGCGIGGTSRYLAKHLGCTVTGITISGRQVQIAKKLTLAETASEAPPSTNDSATEFLPLPPGKVRLLELDAETMLSYFTLPSERSSSSFNCIWISEALSHVPSKPLFFSSAYSLLRQPNTTTCPGLLVIADWFRAPDLTPQQLDNDIKPIEDGMLLPKLHTIDEYVSMAEAVGFRLKDGGGPFDISKDVARTWDISWSLISSPSLWTFAIAQGHDGLAFLQAFRAMRRGYANGSFRYGVMCFEKR